jgi:hypothetical protein
MKTKDTVINITKEGNLEFIEGQMPLALPLGDGTSRRVSTIRPERFAKRTAFLFLRRLAGERGRIAAWTRTWAGPWRCVILATGQTEVFDQRQAAIDWELEILTDPKFDL